MPSLRDIKRRIGAVRNTAKITQAQRMVAVAKLKRAQDAIQNARPYITKLNSILSNLVESVGEDYTHPLIQKREVEKIAVIIISSDRGMCGSFNTNLLRFANIFLNKDIYTQHPNAKPSIISVGKRAVSFFSRTKFDIKAEFPGIFLKLDFSSAKSISQLVSNGFINYDFDKVLIFYNEFKNLISQIPKVVTLLPIEPSQTKSTDNSKFRIDYIFEPDRKRILDELLPKNLEIQIWRSLLESNAAEQAARMMAMETATNNANELIGNLELAYNKARQASITKEMLEIVSGAEAMRKA